MYTTKMSFSIQDSGAHKAIIMGGVCLSLYLWYTHSQNMTKAEVRQQQHQQHIDESKYDSQPEQVEQYTPQPRVRPRARYGPGDPRAQMAAQEPMVGADGRVIIDAETQKRMDCAPSIQARATLSGCEDRDIEDFFDNTRNIHSLK